MKKIKKNYTEAMCDDIERDHAKGINEFTYAKEYISKLVGNNRDELMKIKAEAQEGDFVTYLSVKMAILACVLTGVGVANDMLPKFDNIIIEMFIHIFFLIIIIIMALKTLTFQNFNSIGKWRQYVLVAVEDLISEMSEEKEAEKEAHKEEIKRREKKKYKKKK